MKQEVALPGPLGNRFTVPQCSRIMIIWLSPPLPQVNWVQGFRK